MLAVRPIGEVYLPRTLATSAELTPLLVCDVWEHAYYIDYRQDRKSFLEAWFDKVANWEFAAAQFSARAGGTSAWRFADAA